MLLILKITQEYPSYVKFTQKVMPPRAADVLSVIWLYSHVYAENITPPHVLLSALLHEPTPTSIPNRIGELGSISLGGSYKNLKFVKYSPRYGAGIGTVPDNTPG